MPPTNLPVEVRRCTGGALRTNAYVLVEPTTKQSVLIDPGHEPDALHALLAGTLPHAILLTHAHADHIGALDTMRAALQVPVLAHAAAAAHVPLDRRLTDGEHLPLGTATLRCCATPGHSPDMLTFLLGAVGDERIAIVGDTLFAGGPGRTRSAADFQTTLRTLEQIVLRWADQTQCYLGHGPAFRLGDIRGAITGFVQHDHGTFSGNATWAMNPRLIQ